VSSLVGSLTVAELREIESHERAAGSCRAQAVRLGNCPGVYCITDGEFFKVGRTDHSIARRLAVLQCGNPRELTLLFILSLNPNDEGVIQDGLARFHVRGEWYRHTKESILVVTKIWERNGRPGANE
jgi:Meiotically up-regulated gene 113